MNQPYDRGWLLFQRGRFAEAATELQQATASDPNDPYCHGLLALCLSQLDRHQQAVELARRAIELAPDSDHGYYVLARVYAERQHLDEAFREISTAIQLDPEDAMNHAWLARIECERSNWQAAVTAADAGLALDGENDMCLHYRSLALVKLGRGEEARRDQETLLASDPNDPHSHAARGWTLLEEGKSAEAKTHFLEALRLDPTIEYARIGLANALKARYLLFGVALRCLLYMDRFRSWAVWGFFILFAFGLRQLDRVGLANPDLIVPLTIVKAVIWFFLLLIMLAHPLFDLILRLDREGRRVLSDDQRRATNWHGVCMLTALGMGLLWAWKGGQQTLTLAMTTLMLTYAITATFNATPGWVRTRMKWLTIFAALLIPISYIGFLASIILTIGFRMNAVWMIKPTLVYLPLLSMLLSLFSENIAEYLEKRRPDAVT